MVQTVKVETDTSLIGILTAAFIFIIGLSWNDAFKNFFSTSTPYLKKYGPWGYAIGVTIIGIFSIQFLATNKYINKINHVVETKEEQRKNKNEE